MRIKVDTAGFKLVRTNAKRVKKGVQKMKEALEQDYRDSLNKPSGLPKDWRSRILK